jgi:molecular chaperone GrpE
MATPNAADGRTGTGADERVAPATGRRSPAEGHAAGSGADDALRPSASSASDPQAQEADESVAAAVAELEDRWRRAAADLDNSRKRFARDLARELAVERDRVAAAWLPVLDNLELALAHADAEKDAVVAGVRAVHEQAVELLARLGYPRNDEVNVPFDPTKHEVVTVVQDPGVPPGTVVQVFRPGYGEAERQLRPSSVAVNRTGE